MKKNSILIIFSAPIQYKNEKNPYLYRQKSDFLYLTNCHEPNSALVIIKRKKKKVILFKKKPKKNYIIWNQEYISFKKTKKKLNFKYIYSYKKIKLLLPKYLKKAKFLYYVLNDNLLNDKFILKIIKKNQINHFFLKKNFINWKKIVHLMRLRKNKIEINLMKKSAKISSLSHIKAIKFCKPGLYEYQIEAKLLYYFCKFGARFTAYNTIVASGKNSSILHYTKNSKKIEKGELIIIDAGCEFKNYASDITRTIPANGRFSNEQKEIYSIVLDSINLAIKWLIPGALVDDIEKKVILFIIKKLISLGVIKGVLKKIFLKKKYKHFYAHKLSHWIGLDVHDCSFYAHQNHKKKDFFLKPNMVLTVEPGIYLSLKNKKIKKKYRGINIRIEDTIIIKKKKNENITKKVPKNILEIEKIMQKK